MPKVARLLLFMMLAGCAAPAPANPGPAPYSPTGERSPTACLPWAFPGLIAACPTDRPQHFNGATRRFERGFMLWLGRPERFYVFFEDPAQTYLFIGEPFTWQDGEANIPSPPEGFHPAEGGFGILWRGRIDTHLSEYANLRERLGWSTEQYERIYETDYQCVTPDNYWEQQCLILDTDGNVVLLKPDPAVSPAGLWQVVARRK
jgi:hypothetical protein